MNPLNKFNGNGNQGNNPMQMMNQFMEFAKGFNGNAEEEVMKLLSQGKMTQEQLNQITNFAKQVQPMLEKFGIKL